MSQINGADNHRNSGNRTRFSGRRVIQSDTYQSICGSTTAYVSTTESATGVCSLKATPTRAPPPAIRSTVVTVPPNCNSITPVDSTYYHTSSYTDLLNSRVNRMVILSDTGRYFFNKNTKQSPWRFERAIITPTGIISATACASSLKHARNLVSHMMVDHLAPELQMEHEAPKESVQGLAIQESDKASNTIVTRDEGKTETTVTVHNECSHFASSEPSGRFDIITNRWMPLDPIEVTTGQSLGTLLAAYYLPETLYSLIRNSANLIPFETFIYADMDVTFKFVVNANKFQCGKVVASCKFDSYQADAVQASVRSALHRPHVMLDLASNNEGELHVPFRYHRAFVRLVGDPQSNRGVRPAKYATVSVQVLSELRTGTDNPTNMYIRPFVTMSRINFSGMSHRVELQMESAITGLTPLLSAVEPLLSSIGSTPNRDKPNDIRNTIVVPKARYNFGTGKGPTDVSSLRMDPSQETAYTCVQPYGDDPMDTLTIAQIWGLRAKFTWGASNTPGALLYDFVVDPSCRQYANRYSGVPTPLEYVTSLYNFWSGTTEMRLDFMSNAFHSGSVQISVEFNRPSTDDDNEKSSASTYTKTFHLGEQKSVSMTIPYIYDTVWRRSCTLPYNPALLGASDRRVDRAAAAALYAQSRTTVSIRVINELRPVSTVPQEIDVLLYWRATPSYRLHSLKQSSFYFSRESGGDTRPTDKFPAGYYGDEGENDGRDGDEDTPSQELPEESRNQYNEYSPSQIPTEQTFTFEPTDDDGIEEVEAQMERIVLQMDSGSKEALDSTADFSVGSPALTVQTSDTQTNIKDILRRPVLLYHNVLVEGLAAETSNGFFIPLQPPNRNFAIRNPRETRLMSPMIGQTPQAQLMSLFRFWRGSMRYTIIVEDGSKTPIYITHVPHSGVRLFGNTRIGFDSQGRARDAQTFKSPIYATGLTTEILIPQVNPTIQVETPFDTENNWCLTFEEDPGRRYTWRDKGDTNVGHLVLTCRSDVNVSIWWSAGDDFEVANFYGIPNCVANDTNYALADIRFQMESSDDEDFLDCDSSVSGSTVSAPTTTSRPSNIERTLRLGAFACAAQVPIVGPALLSYKAFSAMDQGEITMRGVDDATSQIARLSQSLSSKVDSISDAVQHLYSELLKSFKATIDVTRLGSDLLSAASDLLFDLAFALLNQSWQVAACSLVRLFFKYAGFKRCLTTLTDPCQKIVTELANFIRSYLAPKSDIHLQGPSTESTLVGLCASLVSLAFGVVIDSKHQESIIKRFAHGLTSNNNMAYINQVIRLFNTTFDILKEQMLILLGMASPENSALAMFSQNSELVQRFITDAQLVTCEANVNMISIPQFRTKFWLTMVNAYQIQSILCRISSSNVASAPLMRLCEQVIKLGNERMVDMTACPVRFEPFVICIEGAPGIGKSFLNERLIQLLLKAVNFTRPTSGTTYIRQPGSTHWSGYRDQPAVSYDDAFNLNDQQLMVTTLKEFYQLKSCSIFTPDMAHLEDKRIRANPLLVTMLCNNAFPSQISNVAIHKEAVFRRRDVLIRARMVSGYTTESLREMSEEDSANMVHLEFSFHRQPRNAQAGYDEQWYKWPDFVNKITERFTHYYDREIINVRKRIQNLQSALTQMPPDQLDLEDPFKIFWDAQFQSAPTDLQDDTWLPSEQLSLAVMEASRAIEHGFKTKTLSVTDPKGDVEPQGASYDTLENLTSGLSSIFTTLTIGKAKCSKCAIRAIVAVRCKGPEVSHSFCHQCTAEMNGAFKCPCCKLGLEVPVVCSQVIALLRSIGKYTHAEIAGAIRAAMKSDPKRLFSFLLQIELLSFVYELAHIPKSSLLAGITAYGTWVSQRTPIHNRTRVHNAINIWYDDDDIEQVAESLSMEELRERMQVVNPNMSRYAEFTSHSSGNQQCYHHVVKEKMMNISTTYIPGKVSKWRFLPPEEFGDYYMEIPDQVCADPDCLLRDEQQCHSFYATWFVHRRKDILQSLSNYLTLPVRSHYYREMVPLMLRPPWMTPPQLSVATDWWNYVSEQYQKHRLLINILVGVAATTATIYGTIKFIAPLFAKPIVQAEAATYYDSERTRHLRRVLRKTNIRGSKHDRISFQNEQQHSQVRETVRHNMVTIRIWKDDKLSRTLGGLAVCGKLVLIPKHYHTYLSTLEYSDGSIVITFERSTLVQQNECNHTRQRYTFDEADFKDHETTDLCLFELPASFPSFRDIRKHFVNDADISQHLPTTGTIEITPNSVRKFVDSRRVNLLRLECEVVAVKGTTEEILRDVITYNFSQDGACGSPLVLERSQRPILSLHSAGSVSKQLGYGTIVTQELLQEIMGVEPVMLQLEDNDCLLPLSDLENPYLLDPDANVTYLGGVPPNLEHHTPKKTKLRPSAIQNVGTLSPLTAPTILSAADPRYTHSFPPLYYGCSKHGVKTIDPPTSKIKEVSDAMWRGWYSGMKPLILNPRVLSYREAVVGIPEVEYYDCIKMNTSSGYPWTLRRSNDCSKNSWIELIRDDQDMPIDAVIDPILIAEIERKNELRRKGIQPLTIFADTLKDERKLEEKVLKPGATRVFCASPIDYTITCRQYLLHFCASFMKSRLDVMSGVGIDAHGYEWTDLYRYLRGLGCDNIVALDYSNYGPGFNSVIAKGAISVMIQWGNKYVQDFDPKLTEMLLLECINSTHIVQNTIYQQQSGSPSGAPITTIINSVVNHGHILWAWLEIAGPILSSSPTWDGDLWDEFVRNVRLVVYGDDLIMNVSDKWIPSFNGQTIQAFFAKYKITATGTEKTDVTPRCVSIRDASFLKRGFAPHPTRHQTWLAPLKWSSINDATQWIWSTADDVLATIENCKSALNEAHGHGPVAYSAFLDRINDALAICDIRPGITLSWEHLDRTFYKDLTVDSVFTLQMEKEQPPAPPNTPVSGCRYISPQVMNRMYEDHAETLIGERDRTYGYVAITAASAAVLFLQEQYRGCNMQIFDLFSNDDFLRHISPGAQIDIIAFECAEQPDSEVSEELVAALLRGVHEYLHSRFGPPTTELFTKARRGFLTLEEIGNYLVVMVNGEPIPYSNYIANFNQE